MLPGPVPNQWFQNVLSESSARTVQLLRWLKKSPLNLGPFIRKSHQGGEVAVGHVRRGLEFDVSKVVKRNRRPGKEADCGREDACGELEISPEHGARAALVVEGGDEGAAVLRDLSLGREPVAAFGDFLSWLGLPSTDLGRESKYFCACFFIRHVAGSFLVVHLFKDKVARGGGHQGWAVHTVGIGGADAVRGESRRRVRAAVTVAWAPGVEKLNAEGRCLLILRMTKTSPKKYCKIHEYRQCERCGAALKRTVNGSSEPSQPENTFEVGEDHFNLLSEPHRDCILFGLGNINGDLMGVFVFFAGD